MRLCKNTIIITGGTSGIGRGLAERLAAAGNQIIIAGRRKDRLAEISASAPGIVSFACDLSVDADRESFCRWIIERYPDTNMLINNAGVQLHTDMTRPVDVARVRSELETNLVAPVHLSSLLIPHLKTKSTAAIINISSGLAMIPLAFMPVYCATKAALHSLTISLRHQLRATSVRVFEIAPPAVDTELGHDARADKTQSHGGMPIEAFLKEAIQAIEDDVYEAPIADAKRRWQNRQTEFDELNARFG